MTYAVRFWGVRDNKPKPIGFTWDELKPSLLKHRVQDDKFKGWLYSPVTYLPDSHRGNKNVTFVNAFVADLDGENLGTALERLADFEHIAYTTHSHREDDQHWHIVIPLSQPVPSHQWFSVWKQMHDYLGIDGDPQTCDPARIFFAPQHAEGNPFETIHNQGMKFPTPQNRYSDRPPVVRRSYTMRIDDVDQECVCDGDEVCLKCQIDFAGLDLSRYNGLEGKELAAKFLEEFLLIKAGAVSSQ